jgi:hypothetical protein
MPTVAAYCILCHCGSKTLSILKDQLASFRIEELVSSVLIEKKKREGRTRLAIIHEKLNEQRFLLGLAKKKTLSVGPHGCRPCYSCPRTRLQILIISYDGNHEALYLFLLFVIKGLNSLKLSRRISAPAFKKKSAHKSQDEKKHYLTLRLLNYFLGPKIFSILYMKKMYTCSLRHDFWRWFGYHFS